jgi:hypothetical protein
MANEKKKYTEANVSGVLFKTKNGNDIWKIHTLPDGKNAMLVSIQLGSRVGNQQNLKTATATYAISDVVSFLNNGNWIELIGKPQFTVDLAAKSKIEIDELADASEWVGNFKG